MLSKKVLDINRKITYTISIVKVAGEDEMGLADLIFEDYTPSPAEMMDEVNALLLLDEQLNQAQAEDEIVLDIDEDL